MRFADRFKTMGRPVKPRTEAQKAADAARSETAARARKAKVERIARMKAARRASKHNS